MNPPGISAGLARTRSPSGREHWNRFTLHHFPSKLGIYVFVRGDVERRLLDVLTNVRGQYS